MSNLKIKCPVCSFKYEISLDRELRRTNDQNCLYWLYLTIIAEEIGELIVEDLHEDLKRLLNPKPSKLELGKSFGGSTAVMKRKQFSEYVEKVKIWALKFHGITLPEAERGGNDSTNN